MVAMAMKQKLWICLSCFILSNHDHSRTFKCQMTEVARFIIADNCYIPLVSDPTHISYRVTRLFDCAFSSTSPPSDLLFQTCPSLLVIFNCPYSEYYNMP